MTYGEAHTAEHDSLTLVNGRWKKALHIDKKPLPMKREDAVRYYNKKLFFHALSKLDNRASMQHRKQTVSLFMFGNTEYYKKHEELL